MGDVYEKNRDRADMYMRVMQICTACMRARSRVRVWMRGARAR